MAKKKYLRKKIASLNIKKRPNSRFVRKAKLRNWYLSIKNGLKCKTCGETNPHMLDFHHVDRKEKKSSISNMISKGRPKAAILREMQKCEIQCACCHRKLHYGSGKISLKGKSKIEKIIIKIKNNAKCAYCDENSPAALDFHHLDPSKKKFSIGNAIKMRLTEEEILEEIAKTKFLCANHHRLEHALEREKKKAM